MKRISYSFISVLLCLNTLSITGSESSSSQLRDLVGDALSVDTAPERVGGFVVKESPKTPGFRHVPSLPDMSPVRHERIVRYVSEGQKDSALAAVALVPVADARVIFSPTRRRSTEGASACVGEPQKKIFLKRDSLHPYAVYTSRLIATEGININAPGALDALYGSFEEGGLRAADFAAFCRLADHHGFYEFQVPASQVCGLLDNLAAARVRWHIQHIRFDLKECGIADLKSDDQVLAYMRKHLDGRVVLSPEACYACADIFSNHENAKQAATDWINKMKIYPKSAQRIINAVAVPDMKAGGVGKITGKLK